MIKRNLGLFAIVFISTLALAAGFKDFSWDQMRFGGSAAGVRSIVFDQNPDGNSAELSVDPADEEFVLNNKVNALTGLDVTGQLTVASTTQGSRPCPAMTQAQRDAIVTPGDGDCIFNTDTKDLNTYNGTGSIWRVAGSASGDGSYNNIDNGKASENADGWVVYANTAAGVKPDDFGGTPNVGFTWARNLTTPLNEPADFLLTKPAANVQGNGVYYEFTAQKAHLAVMNLLTIYTDTTLLNDGDFSVWLVSSSDSFVADFNIISTNIPDVLVGSPRFLKQFQFDSTDTEYRLCLHWNSTDTDAKTARFDDVLFGPRDVATSAVVLDDKAFTPNWTGFTTSSHVANYSQVGEYMNVRVNAQLNSAVSTSIRLEIPGGYKIDVNKLNTTNLGKTVFGNATATDVGSSYYSGNVSYGGTDTTVAITFNSGFEWAASYPHTWASGDEISLNFSVPIQGWSSNAVTSEDLGNTDVFLEYYGNGDEVISANVTDIPFATKREDNTTSWDGSKYTAKTTEKIQIEATMRWNTNAARSIYLYVDGVERKLLKVDPVLGFNSISTIVKLEAKQTASLRISTSDTLSNDSAQHYISIQKYSSPQTLLDTAKVSAAVTNISGFNVATSLSWTKVTGYTVNNDDAGYWSTVNDQYQTRVSGTFKFSANAFFVANATGQRGIRIRKNGGDTGFGSIINASSALETNVSTEGEIDLLPGDIITIEVIQSSGGALALQTSTDISTNFSISRIK